MARPQRQPQPPPAPPRRPDSWDWNKVTGGVVAFGIAVIAIIFGVSQWQLSRLGGDIDKLGSRVDALYTDFGTMKAGVASLQTEMAYLRRDLEGVRADVTATREIVGRIETRLASQGVAPTSHPMVRTPGQQGGTLPAGGVEGAPGSRSDVGGGGGGATAGAAGWPISRPDR